MTINSWISTLLAAWAPPLSIFIMGTGRIFLSSGQRHRHKGCPAEAAAALAAARETASRALAPRRLLFLLPSASRRALSTWRQSPASSPFTAAAKGPRTFSTAWRTPLPPYRAGSLSRSSWASWAPVEAPEGTFAQPVLPSSSSTPARRVGFPRLSRISRAVTWRIFDEDKRIFSSSHVKIWQQS